MNVSVRRQALILAAALVGMLTVSATAAAQCYSNSSFTSPQYSSPVYSSSCGVPSRVVHTGNVVRVGNSMTSRVVINSSDTEISRSNDVGRGDSVVTPAQARLSGETQSSVDRSTTSTYPVYHQTSPRTVRYSAPVRSRAIRYSARGGCAGGHCGW